MTTISETLRGLSLGDPTTFLNLTVFPLHSNKGYRRDYITLREAVQAGTATVREISEGGSVPELQLHNTGKQPVLILDGEELIGAKQNRTANVTILAPAGKSVHIPVTCVEAGRWSYTSRDFAPSDQMHYSAGRKRKMSSVYTSLSTTGARSADQGQVWSDIGDKAQRMRSPSPTGAMSDIYQSHRHSIDDYVKAFTAQAGQCGAVFAIGKHVEGLELFDCADTLTDMLPKLVRSYAIDALEGGKSNPQGAKRKRAEEFLQLVIDSPVETFPAVGLGTEVRMSASGLIAGGLVADDRVVHLAAFSAPVAANDGDGGGGFFASLGSRRRRMYR
jgi:hypothetical protein